MDGKKRPASLTVAPGFQLSLTIQELYHEPNKKSIDPVGAGGVAQWEAGCLLDALQLFNRHGYASPSLRGVS